MIISINTNYGAIFAYKHIHGRENTYHYQRGQKTRELSPLEKGLLKNSINTRQTDIKGDIRVIHGWDHVLSKNTCEHARVVRMSTGVG